jgi:hypothetical protein
MLAGRFWTHKPSKSLSVTSRTSYLKPSVHVTNTNQWTVADTHFLFWLKNWRENWILKCVSNTYDLYAIHTYFNPLTEDVKAVLFKGQGRTAE